MSQPRLLHFRFVVLCAHAESDLCNPHSSPRPIVDVCLSNVQRRRCPPAVRCLTDRDR